MNNTGPNARMPPLRVQEPGPPPRSNVPHSRSANVLLQGLDKGEQVLLGRAPYQAWHTTAHAFAASSMYVHEQKHSQLWHYTTAHACAALA